VVKFGGEGSPAEVERILDSRAVVPLPELVTGGRPLVERKLPRPEPGQRSRRGNASYRRMPTAR
jgi:hypothetical protein